MADYTDIIDPDNGAGTDYTSLSTWEANANADHGAGAGDSLTAQCRSSGGTDDTTLCTIDGLTVDTVTIEGIDFPADGIYDGTKYVLNPGNYSECLIITAGEPDITIRNIQFLFDGNHNASTGGITANYIPSSDVIVLEGIIMRVTSGSAGIFALELNASANSGQTGDITVKNSVISGVGTYSTSMGIRTGTYTGLKIYNTTVSGFGTGCYDTQANVLYKNNTVFNNTDDFNCSGSIDYCASDDADGTNAQDLNENAGGEWVAAFTDYSNGDFSVKDTSSLLYNHGTDLSGSGVTDDIIGTARPQATTYDIGAFEYPAASGSSTPVFIHHILCST